MMDLLEVQNAFKYMVDTKAWIKSLGCGSFVSGIAKEFLGSEVLSRFDNIVFLVWEKLLLIVGQIVQFLQTL